MRQKHPLPKGKKNNKTPPKPELYIKYYWDQIWYNNKKITNYFVSSYTANCILLHACQLFSIPEAFRKAEIV